MIRYLDFDNGISREALSKGVFEKIQSLSQVDTNVLIQGERGTCKESVARTIHDGSTHKDGEFVAVNCAAIIADSREGDH